MKKPFLILVLGLLMLASCEFMKERPIAALNECHLKTWKLATRAALDSCDDKLKRAKGVQLLLIADSFNLKERFIQKFNKEGIEMLHGHSIYLVEEYTGDPPSYSLYARIGQTDSIYVFRYQKDEDLTEFSMMEHGEEAMASYFAAWEDWIDGVEEHSKIYNCLEAGIVYPSFDYKINLKENTDCSAE